MHSILIQLENDHQHIVRMLYLLDKEIAMLVGTRTGKAQFDVIIDILDYLQVYPKFWHHPAESILLNYFLDTSFPTEKMPDNIDSLRLTAVKLGDEHAVLDAMSEQLVAIFAELHLSNSQAYIDFQRIFKLFFERQASHIRNEREIFNTIDNCFTASNWQLVDERINHEVDADSVSDKEFYVQRANEFCMSNAVTDTILPISNFSSVM